MNNRAERASHPPIKVRHSHSYTETRSTSINTFLSSL